MLQRVSVMRPVVKGVIIALVSASAGLTSLDSPATDVLYVFTTFFFILLSFVSLSLYLYFFFSVHRYIYLVFTICAVATSCCMSDVPSQWEGQNFDPPSIVSTFFN